jgi:signal transduction histidine kinase
MTVRTISHVVTRAREVALVATVAVAPVGAVVVLGPRLRSTASGESISLLVTQGVALAAALVVYLHWRMSHRAAVGWLTVGLVASAVPALTLAVVNLVDPISAPQEVLWALAVLLAISVGQLLVVRAAGRVPPPSDPVLVGAGLGFVVALAYVAARDVAAGVAPPPGVVPALGVAVVVVVLAATVTVLRLPGLSRSLGVRFALVLALLDLSLLVTHVRPVEADLALAGGAAGALLLSCTAFSLVRASISEAGLRIESLHRRLGEAEARNRDDRALLHEVGSTVAGIASASRLVRDSETLPPARRLALEEMVDAEVSRLQRLLNATGPSPRTFDVDDVIGPLVISQQARGREVTWTPTRGLRAAGRPDDVAEVVNILLENAARHGAGSDTRVTVHDVDDRISIAVSDLGPGVDPQVRARLFEWESRGPQSPGQGIGLHIAHQLVAELEGELRLDESVGLGATFVVDLRPDHLHVGSHDAVRRLAS